MTVTADIDDYSSGEEGELGLEEEYLQQRINANQLLHTLIQKKKQLLNGGVDEHGRAVTPSQVRPLQRQLETAVKTLKPLVLLLCEEQADEKPTSIWTDLVTAAKRGLMGPAKNKQAVMLSIVVHLSKVEELLEMDVPAEAQYKNYELPELK